jgi:hypothetical protein
MASDAGGARKWRATLATVTTVVLSVAAVFLLVLQGR